MSDSTTVRARVLPLIATAFGAETTVGDLSDAGGDRGVFSEIIRASLEPGSGPGGPEIPASVIVKLPADDQNGRAAAEAGAYRREAFAYREIVARSPVDVPRCFHIDEGPNGTASFVLEDLTPHRAVDQLVGLSDADVGRVVDALARLHSHWRHDLESLRSVRRSTPIELDPERLELGMVAVVDRWSSQLEPDVVAVYRRVLGARPQLLEAFADQTPTLCHGDPRADNLVFTANGSVVLFDWQQIAVQLGEADIAWLTATSIDPRERRRLDHSVVARYASAVSAPFDASERRYRLGMILPGLAVLMLAQRNTVDGTRASRFVATSLQRIGAALLDLDVATA